MSVAVSAADSSIQSASITEPLIVSTATGDTVLVAQPDGAGCWSSPPYTICENPTGDLNVTPGAVTAQQIAGTACWTFDQYVVRPQTVPFTACTPAPPTTVPPTTTVPPATTTSPSTTTTVAGGSGFVEPFDTLASLDRFDFAVHHAWTANATRTSWSADHDIGCGGANTTRTIVNPTTAGTTYYPGMIGPTSYWCHPAGANPHLMTAFNTLHYAQVDFAPKPVLTDINRVCWDQSRTAMGSRHWTQLAVVPLSTFTANNNRLDYVASRFSPTGPGKYGLHPVDETLLVEFGKGVPRVQVGQQVFDSNGLAWNAGSNRTTRYQHCVIDTGSGLRIEIGRDGGTEVFQRGGGIPDGPVKVIFQQDLYNPDKANDATGAYTVHWDNILID